MPPLTATHRVAWWGAVLSAGPGRVIPGAIKQIAGGLLAVWIVDEVGQTLAVQPIQQFTHGLGLVLPTWLVLPVAVLFVVISQIKINVTNAYSGSLSWSNFFSRVLHAHPGRVVYLFLDVGVALLLMELGVFGFLDTVLGFYSDVAIAWIGAVVADLVINKPLLKLSPCYIEVERAHLCAVNPMGFGAVVIASVVSIIALFGRSVRCSRPAPPLSRCDRVRALAGAVRGHQGHVLPGARRRPAAADGGRSGHALRRVDPARRTPGRTPAR